MRSRPFSDIDERIYPVGRLDRDSEGLLICTNDGEFANMLTHPSKHISKTYHVTVRPRADEEQLVKMSVGVVIDGKKTSPASIQLLKEEEDRSMLQMTLHEGRNREIRKMCEAVGLETIRLKRVSVGSLALGRLPLGKYRELTKEEIESLKRLSKKADENEKGGRTNRRRSK